MAEIVEKQVERKPHWIMSIGDMSTERGPSYPFFEWSFGFKNGMRAGELRAWSSHGGILIFEDRLRRKSWECKSIEEALKKIDDYGWGKPPYIEDIFQDIMATQEKIPAENLEEAERILKELRLRWESLVAS